MPWSIILVAIAFVVFAGLAKLTPCNPGQKVLSRDLPDDVLYYLVGTFLYTGLSAALLKILIDWAFAGNAAGVWQAIQHGYGPQRSLPIWLQVLLVFVVTDVIQYWLHRAFHTSVLWPFHAVHHSAESVDWTTTFRVHPVQFLIYSAGVAMLVAVMGFSPVTFVVVAPVNFFVGTFVHSNLNWTLGPLRYVIATPVFHRWHHSNDPALCNKNFAPTFPVLDLMFGTFHMPKDRLPSDYGAEGVPPNFLGQMAYPFAALITRFTRRAPTPGFGSGGA
ncbi:MAG TPA: sterol desaturase family protein [Caulobacteraceae bacterium]|jgi:sterol desaturase/sphingolipid hydroxylase (fatty acid hydroxylase superfamily)